MGANFQQKHQTRDFPKSALHFQELMDAPNCQVVKHLESVQIGVQFPVGVQKKTKSHIWCFDFGFWICNSDGVILDFVFWI